MTKRLVAFSVAVLAAALSGAEEVARGLWKSFDYEKPDAKPIVFGGWSRAENAHAPQYCVMLDVSYANGGHSWAVRANFRCGTHDWEETRGVFIPKSAVSNIAVHAIFRGKDEFEAMGQVEFRDFFLERRKGKGDEFPLREVTCRPLEDVDEVTMDVLNGRKVTRVVKKKPCRTPRTSPLASGTAEVWVEDSMRAVTPLTMPKADAGKSIALSLARRERESAQLLVSTAADVSWNDVTLEMPQLTNAAGKAFAGSVSWQRQGYWPRPCEAPNHPFAPPDNGKWVPDPLLPPAAFRVRPASTQGTWVTACASPEAEAGRYAGEVVVREGGEVRARVPMTVEVFDFSLPSTFGLKTAFALMDGYLRAVYGDDFRAMKREAIDTLLDHRMNPDDISRTTPPEIGDLLHARKRGMNAFNILNVVPPPTDPKTVRVLTAKPEEIFTDEFYAAFLGRLRPYVDELRKHGLDRMAYVYGFDERGKEYYAGMADFWRKLRADLPGIPLLTTSLNYAETLAGKIDRQTLLAGGDWYCPPTFRYDDEQSAWLRQEGREVWWYTTGRPHYPYANFASFQNQLIEGRILIGWQTWRKRADGFLFWLINGWQGAGRLPEGETFFPQFRTDGRRSDFPCGSVYLYPGEKHVLPSIRLAQMRDAVEDYEYLQLFAGLKGRGAADRVVDVIVQSMTEFTRSPEALRKARRQLAEALGKSQPCKVE